MNNQQYSNHRQLSFDDTFEQSSVLETEDQSKKLKQKDRTTFPIPLVRDFEKLMQYVENHSIKLTKKNSNIATKHLPFINEQLSIQATDITKNMQQKYYHYLDLLFSLALNGGLLERKISRLRLDVTDRWIQFQELTDTEKYCFLLETFWVDIDWTELVDDNKVYWHLPELVERLTDDRSGMTFELDQNPTLAIDLDNWKYFLLYFEWFGFWICEKNQMMMEKYANKMSYFAKKITLTPFGEKMFSTLVEERDLSEWNITFRRQTFKEIHCERWK